MEVFEMELDDLDFVNFSRYAAIYCKIRVDVVHREPTTAPQNTSRYNHNHKHHGRKMVPTQQSNLGCNCYLVGTTPPFFLVLFLLLVFLSSPSLAIVINTISSATTNLTVDPLLILSLIPDPPTHLIPHHKSSNFQTCKPLNSKLLRHHLYFALLAWHYSLFTLSP
jgi:hypothetical protein